MWLLLIPLEASTHSPDAPFFADEWCCLEDVILAFLAILSTRLSPSCFVFRLMVQITDLPVVELKTSNSAVVLEHIFD